MRIKLVRKDGEVSEEISLAEGTHIFGRGRIINCDDKRVSRNHVSLQISKEGTIMFTALHPNPCFYYSPVKPSYAEVLHQYNRRQLKDEDEISLLPESFRYAVQVIEGADLSNENELEKPVQDIQSIDNMSSGRNFEETQLLEPESESRMCVDEEVDDDVIPVIEEVNHVDLCEEDEVVDFNEPESTTDGDKEKNDSQSLTNVSSPSKRKHDDMNEGEEGADPVSGEVRNEEDSPIEGSCKKAKVESPEDRKPDEQQLQDCAASSAGQDLPLGAECSSSSGSTQVKQEELAPNVKVEKKESAADPEGVQPRDKCEFGGSCYRRNPQHRKDMSHPGDPDWDAPVSCPYGANCYRTNAQHRRMYTHPGPPAPRPNQQNGKNDKQRKTTKPKKSRSKRRKRTPSCSDSSLDAVGSSGEDAPLESGNERSNYEDSDDGNEGGTRKRRGVQTRTKILKKRQVVKYYHESGDESEEEEDPWDAADSSDDYEPATSGEERDNYEDLSEHSDSQATPQKKTKHPRKPVVKKARR